MPSRLTLECPVSGLTTEVAGDTVRDGEPDFETPDEDDTQLPPGWGRLKFDVAGANPEYARVAAFHETARNEIATAVNLDDEVPKDAKATVIDQQMAIILGEHPLPENEFGYEARAFDVLSPEAVAAIRGALKGIGVDVG